MRELAVYEDAIIVIRDGRFVFVGRDADIDADLRASIADDFDAQGATALPGFIDSHTHIPFAGYRETEFNRRLQGETYEQIAASGGGIASSVHATRHASQQELVGNILDRASTMARYGTTTAEAKSGYGLTIDAELKQLRAIRDANERSPVRLIPTCLAAHDFPPENRTAEYVEEVIETILPAVADENQPRAAATSRRLSAKSCPPSPRKSLRCFVTSSSSAAFSQTKKGMPSFAPVLPSASSRACTPTSSPTPTAPRSPHPSAVHLQIT